MPFRAPIGHSDFAKLRRAEATYVDKTALIAEVLASPTEVLLLPRPRRFGKTLNLSTLRYFLERTDEDRSDLWRSAELTWASGSEGLAVWESEEARHHFQRYPVVFRRWLQDGVGSGAGVRQMLAALLSGDTPTFAHHLTVLLRDTLSYFDLGGRQPERIYHAFIAGLLVHLGEEYEVRSNRESGYGRYDVMVLPRPPGRPGVVLELKVPDEDQAVESALDAAERQLADRDYAADLRARGADPVHELAAVFDGKWAHVRRCSPGAAGR